jgi:DNA-binding transcriptional regulator YiaG
VFSRLGNAVSVKPVRLTQAKKASVTLPSGLATILNGARSIRMSISGLQFEFARSSLHLSREAVATELGLSTESVLKAEQGTQTDQAILDRLKAFYVNRGITMLGQSPLYKVAFSVIDEVERMGDEIEERSGPHSDPAY